MSAGAQRWADAATAAALIAIDPAGLVGAIIRARPGDVRDRWVAHLAALMDGPKRRLPIGVDEDRLLGGLDLTATLQAGRAVAQRGVLAEADGGLIVAPMAERMSAATAAHIACALDAGRVRTARDGLNFAADARFAFVALDEGIADDEQIRAALADRLAFVIDLDGMRSEDCDFAFDAADLDAARAQWRAVAPAEDSIIEAIVAAAAAYAITSTRAPLMALRAARAAAALRGAGAIDLEDVVFAAGLTLLPRARVLPNVTADDDPNPEQKPPPEADRDADSPQTLADQVLAAVEAAAPADLLAQIAASAAHRRSSGRAGAEMNSGARGRPSGVRAGKPVGGRRLDVPATLRAAAPWQAIRRRAEPEERSGIRVRGDDLRIQRRIERAEATTIFVVDASGSAALHRLAECKGAVELLLAQAYVRRTRAALIAFRQTGAEIVLPPTRSLTRAKRVLADLPGGGGTPLAAGLDAGLRLALAERSHGRTPSLIVMTDARANVARNGQGGREVAEAEALQAARAIRAAAIGAAFVDSSPRPRLEARACAEAMGARYVPLPYPQARAMADIVQTLEA